MCLALVPEMVMFSCSLRDCGWSACSFFVSSSFSAAWAVTAVAGWFTTIGPVLVTVIVGIGGIGVTPTKRGTTGLGTELHLVNISSYNE